MQTLNLILVSESAKARLFENRKGNRMWFPRSVCPRVLKLPKEEGKPQICEVDVADWFLEKNPWPETQGELL